MVRAWEAWLSADTESERLERTLPFLGGEHRSSAEYVCCQVSVANRVLDLKAMLSKAE